MWGLPFTSYLSPLSPPSVYHPTPPELSSGGWAPIPLTLSPDWISNSSLSSASSFVFVSILWSQRILCGAKTRPLATMSQKQCAQKVCGPRWLLSIMVNLLTWPSQFGQANDRLCSQTVSSCTKRACVQNVQVSLVAGLMTFSRFVVTYRAFGTTFKVYFCSQSSATYANCTVFFIYFIYYYFIYYYCLIFLIFV